MRNSLLGFAPRVIRVSPARADLNSILRSHVIKEIKEAYCLFSVEAANTACTLLPGNKEARSIRSMRLVEHHH
jgi:hypothetical protein